MSNTKQKLVDDVHFIFSECSRLHGPEKIRDAPFEDIICSLPHPNSKFGRMICGKAAHDRLSALARAAAKSAGLSQRVTTETVRKPLADILVRRFIKQGRPVNPVEVEKALGAAARAARASCASRIHLVPCHLMSTKDPDEIVIGPVSFLNRRKFRSTIASAVNQYRCVPNTEQRILHRQLLRDALSYYSSFQWVAQVKTDSCDSETSAKRAEEAVTSALDCIHVLLGPRSTSKMRVGGPKPYVDLRGALTIDPSGKLGLGWSKNFSSVGQMNFEDGWSSRLDDVDLRRAISICGIALEYVTNFDLDRPISRRFIEAARWFGDACQDKNPATKIIKFMTSLERLMMTEEREEITRLLSERTAALCFDPAVVGDRDLWRTEVCKAYDMRSSLVHGSVSPKNASLWDSVELCEKITRTALCMIIEGFGSEGFRIESKDVKPLSAWFSELIENADALERANSL